MERLDKILGKFLVVVIAMTALTACNPFKVTDPNDPRFDPMQFKFEDYNQFEELQRAGEKVFPKGTPQSFVEDILVKKNNAKVYPGLSTTNNNIYAYEYKNWKVKLWQGFHSGIPPYVLHVFYDENGKVNKVCAHSKQCRMIKENKENKP